MIRLQQSPLHGPLTFLQGDETGCVNVSTLHTNVKPRQEKTLQGEKVSVLDGIKKSISYTFKLNFLNEKDAVYLSKYSHSNVLVIPDISFHPKCLK